MRRGRIPKHRKDLDARRVKVAEYLRDRLSYSEIGKILGISKNAVASDVKKIVANWKEQQKDSYDEHVMIQLGLINEVINKLKNRFDIGDYDTCSLMLKYIERQSKLLGLDDFYERQMDRTNPIQIIMPSFAKDNPEENIKQIKEEN